MEKLPVYSVDLIQKLNEMYPPRNPRIHQNDREIWFEAGQRALVEFLCEYLNTDESSEGLQQELPEILTIDIRKER